MPEYFRANVGALVLNGRGEILAGCRAGLAEAAWQMPQGGLKRGEAPLAAVWRELAEETGLGPGQVVLLAESVNWLGYTLPEAWRSEKTGIGQCQKWFLFRFQGGEADIRMDAREFSEYRWLAPADLLARVVGFRRPVYAALLAEFAAYLEAADA